MGIDLIGRVSLPPPALHTAAEKTVVSRPVHVAPAAGQQTVPLLERLEGAWQVGRFAPVSDRDLPASVAELIRHHVSVGFFGERLSGMQRLTGFGPDGTLEIQLAPNRNKVPLVTDIGAHESCALCAPPFESERGLAWRNWRIWPNAFPYVPAELEHVLLTCADHVEQQFSPGILGDVIDFQTCTSDGRPLTLHYNGIAGNSQAHLHWQASRVTSPLQREIDAGRMRLDELVRANTGRVATFDQGSYCGILVEGDKSFVVRWADRLVRRLETDPKARGAYNMVLLHRRAGRTRLVVFPRRADNLDVRAGGFHLGVGGFNTAGIIVVPRARVTPEFVRELAPALRATQVPPAELPWLAELGACSFVDLPWNRALLPA